MEEKLALAHPGQAMAAGEEGIKVLANAFEAYFGLLAREVTAGNISWTSLKQYVYDLFGCGAFPDLKARLEAAQKAATASMLMQSPKKRPRLSKEEPPKEGPPNGEPPSKADKQIAIKQKAVKTKAPKRQSIRIRNRNQRALELSGPCASMSLDGPPQETPAFPSQSASARTLVSAETIWEGKTTAQKAAAQSVSGTRRLSMHTLPSLLEMIHVKASKAKPHRRCASEPALSGAGTREFIVVA